MRTRFGPKDFLDLQILTFQALSQKHLFTTPVLDCSRPLGNNHDEDDVLHSFGGSETIVENSSVTETDVLATFTPHTHTFMVERISGETFNQKWLLEDTSSKKAHGVPGVVFSLRNAVSF